MAALTLLPIYPIAFGFAAVLAAGLVLMGRLLGDTPVDDRGSLTWPGAFVILGVLATLVALAFSPIGWLIPLVVLLLLVMA